MEPSLQESNSVLLGGHPPPTRLDKMCKGTEDLRLKGNGGGGGKVEALSFALWRVM